MDRFEIYACTGENEAYSFHFDAQDRPEHFLVLNPSSIGMTFSAYPPDPLGDVTVRCLARLAAVENMLEEWGS